MKSLGCLLVIFILFCCLTSIFYKTDEYDDFIENTTSKRETPWEYLPNKDVGYCVNIDINKSLETSVPETYCANNRPVIESFSHCFHHETGPLGGHVQELMNLTHFCKATSLGRISDYEAGDRARILLCSRKSGGKVIQMNKSYIENDIQKIKAGKEQAKETGVSYKCLVAYVKGDNTTECSDSEIKKIEKKNTSIISNNEQKISKEEVLANENRIKEEEKQADKLREERIPKEKSLANKIGVNQSCLVSYENNYDYFSDEEIYDVLKDDCSKADIQKMIKFFASHPNEHLEELPNGY